MPNAPVTIYNRDRVRVAYCEKAFDIGYRLQKDALWRAWFSLPLDDPKNDEIDDLYYAEIYDGDTRIDLFRVISTKRGRSGGKPVITYQCEHVLGTLMDKTLIGVFNAGPGTTAAINTVLAEQPVENWVLNTQDFARNFYHDWEDVSLLKALFSIPTRFTADHVWTWDTTCYPWRLNLETAPVAVSAKIRYQRELKDIEKTSDARYLYTRLHAFGFGVGAGQVDMLTVDQMAEGRPEFTSGSTEFTVGETLTGAASGETCVVAGYFLESGTYGGGDAQGPLFVTGMSGAFTDGEDLNGSASGANCATLDSSLDHVNAVNIQTAGVKRYGIIDRPWHDQRYTVAANLHEQAAARVDENSVPRATYRLSAMDFNRLDGSNQYVLGDLVRIYDSELSIDVSVRVMLVSKGDVEGKPGDITVQLATEEQKFVNFGDIVYADDLDGVKSGTFGKVLSTSISAGKILLTSGIIGDLDDIDDGGTYSRVLTTDITAGHILLSEATGSLDDIGDGVTYSRVATTEITAGKIVLVSAQASININDTTFGNDGIQLQYNGGNPRAYIGDGANAFIQHDGTKLTWKAANTELDATGNLIATSATLTGSITSTSGAIGGWTIGATTLTGGNLTLDAGNTKITAGTGQDIIIIDAAHATYRIFVGETDPTMAPFSVTKTGVMVAASATITGTITATAGTIGSFKIGTYLYTGTKTAYNDANAGVHVGSDGIGIKSGADFFTVSAAGVVQANNILCSNLTVQAGSTWGGDVLGTAYIPNLSANKITTGTLDCSLLTVSNLSAASITTGTLTGRLIRTASSGTRAVMSVGAPWHGFVTYDAGGKRKAGFAQGGFEVRNAAEAQVGYFSCEASIPILVFFGPGGYAAFGQTSTSGAVEVLTLQQADVSEGFIHFQGSDRGVIAGATASIGSVRVKLPDTTVGRLAVYADA